MNRRRFLKTGGAALASLTLPQTQVRAAKPGPDRTGRPPMPTPFRRRTYLGWITDLASRPDPYAAWPSMRLDAPLLHDYDAAFGTLQALGFNAVSLWGLYVSRDWPTDLSRTVPPERAARVEALLASARRHGLQVLAGLGVYSWGFEEIIRAHPEVSRGNPRAMCASEPRAWDWMRRVIDVVFTRFPVDGVSMQSADQGRCPCDQCRVYSDAQYHALLNVRAASYVRHRWPGKEVGVNSWGMDFSDPASLPSLVETGQHVDYLIDVADSSRRRDPAHRQALVKTLACDFGTLGGPQAEPPQHWTRDRWFLPTVRRTGEHLRSLAEDGGRACEYFFHIAANPGDEVSLWVAGRSLADPQTSWLSHLRAALTPLYGITRASTTDALAALMIEAEEAYFRHLPPDTCGTVSLEPLESNSPGEPVYLSQRLTPAQRTEYARDLEGLEADAQRLTPDVPRWDKMDAIVRCVGNVRQDLARLA